MSALFLSNMFKFLVLGVFLSQTIVKGCYGQTQYSTHDSQPDIRLQPLSPPKNDSSDALIHHKHGLYHIYASRSNIYLGGAFAPKDPAGFASSRADRKLDADYVVTEGIGAHKLHVRALSWGKARRTCVEEGGHLAVIRTELEETILREMMTKKSISLAWVGYSDIFEEGDWFSVLEEPIAETGWAQWSSEFTINPIPDNGHCGELKVEGGLVNQNCKEKRSYICKISID